MKQRRNLYLIGLLALLGFIIAINVTTQPYGPTPTTQAGSYRGPTGAPGSDLDAISKQRTANKPAPLDPPAKGKPLLPRPLGFTTTPTSRTKWGGVFPALSAFSAWMRPIGASATYGSAAVVDRDGVKTGMQLYNIDNGGANDDVTIKVETHFLSTNTTTSDRLVTVQAISPTAYVSSSSNHRCDATSNTPNPATGGTPWQLRIKNGLVIPNMAVGNTENSVATLFQPDGSSHEFNASCSDPAIRAGFINGLHDDIDNADRTIGGLMHFGAHSGSGLSGYGGSIFPGELTNSSPIRHVLSMTVPAQVLNCNTALGFNTGGTANPSAHNWLAYRGDTDGCNGTISSNRSLYSSANTAVKMGTLLALPPSFDCTVFTYAFANGVKPAQKLCENAKNFGWRPADINPWDAWSLNVEQTVESEFNGAGGATMDYPGSYASINLNIDSSQTRWIKDFYTILAGLKPVTNDASGQWTSGGGVALECFAPQPSDFTDLYGAPPTALIPAGCPGYSGTTTTAPSGGCAVPQALSYTATSNDSGPYGAPFDISAIRDGDEVSSGSGRFISSSGTGPWLITANLGSSQALGQLDLLGDPGGAGPYTFTIETSPDNSSWTTRGGTQTAVDTTVCRTYSVLSGVTAQYVRLNVTALSPAAVTAGYHLSVRELRIASGTPATTTTSTTSTSTTSTSTTTSTTTTSTTTTVPGSCIVAGKKTIVTALATSGTAASLKDGDEATSWVASSTAGQTITLDLGSNVPISRLLIKWVANRAGGAIRVQTRTGTFGPWTVQPLGVLTGFSSNGATRCGQIPTYRTFSGVSARQVQIVLLSREAASSGPTSIYELAVY